MIVIATGGRNFDDREFVYKQLDALHSQTPISRLIHGGCEIKDPVSGNWRQSGADWLCDEWVTDRRNRVLRSVMSAKPYFKEYGKVGGRIRNIAMAMYAIGFQRGMKQITGDYPILTCLAFIGGTGTAHMCQVAQQYGFNVIRTWENSELRFE